jgi:hypothetical protein
MARADRKLEIQMSDRLSVLFPHEMEALLAALRRDARVHLRKAETMPEDAQYHLANLRRIVRVLEILSPKGVQRQRQARCQARMTARNQSSRREAPGTESCDAAGMSAEEARYRAAVEEFDRLWETGHPDRSRARMDELAKVIESFQPGLEKARGMA